MARLTGTGLTNPVRYTISAVLFVTLLGGLPAQAEIVLSTTAPATLGVPPLTFRDGDLVDFDRPTETATLIFNEDLFGGNDEEVGAVHVFGNGHIVLSTDSDAWLPGLGFEDEDLVKWDPVNQTATMFFHGDDWFAGEEDIDAACVLDNGHIVLSTDADAKIGSLEFGDGDLVECDPASGMATLLFSEYLFNSHNENIDAVHVLGNGHIVLSTVADAGLPGLNSFEDEDLVEWDPVGQTASMFFEGDLWFTHDEDVDAAFIPEPTTLSLLVLGGVAVMRRRRR